MPDQTPVQRRLVAILAGDVAGYSRLIGVDEVGTLNSLEAIRRELADPTIAAHHRRIAKATRDGTLVEFPSMVDAVACTRWQGGSRYGSWRFRSLRHFAVP